MRLTGRLVLAAAVVGALIVSSAAPAAGSVVGTYTTTLTKPSDHLKGKWVLRLAKGGIYTVVWNGKTLVRGRYTATGTTVTFAPESAGGCAGSGVYAWKRSGKTMTFVRKREAKSCQARAAVLALRFTQVR